MGALLRPVRRVNIANPTFAYDAADPRGFRSGITRPGPELGARKVGVQSGDEAEDVIVPRATGVE
jgi:hypothetical protein